MFKWLKSAVAHFKRKQPKTFEEAYNDPRFNPDAFEMVLKANGVRQKSSMRNNPCFCGSGKKLKKCCWNRLPK